MDAQACLRRGVSLLLFPLFSLQVMAADVSASLWDMSLDELVEVKVYAPSKEWTTITEAPAVITVVTDKEIKLRGLKTLKEVLDRVPGFLTSPDESTYLISNRGFTQNPNSNYLILLDGQALNNQRWEGAEEYFLFPSLSQVKRIEIIRGPGSTLWGSDAAMGMINVISKTGDDLLGDQERAVQLSADYEFHNERHIVNGLVAQRLPQDGSVMLSFTHTASRADWSAIYRAGSVGPEFKDRQMAPYFYYDPSYELHSIAKWRDLRLTGRLFHFEHFDTVGTAEQIQGYPGWRRASEKDTHNGFLRLDYDPQLSESLRLESNVFYSDYRIRRKAYYFNCLPADVFAVDRYDYTDAGLDAMLVHKAGSNTVKLGEQYVRRDFHPAKPPGPADLADPSNCDPQLPRKLTEALSGQENALGVYLEDDYRGIPDFVFTVGARYDRNDFRLPGETVYPRFAAVYNPQGALSYKYSYNRGYVRPPLERVDGTAAKPLIVLDRARIGPSQPQTAISHDFQINYAGPALYLSTTLYRYQIKDYIARLGYEPGTRYNGYLIRYQNQNLGELAGQGVEFDVTVLLSDAVKLYGNFAYAKARFKDLELKVVDGTATFNIVTDMHYASPDRTTTGVPRRLWNLGLDWQLTRRAVMNLHYRGWADNYGKISTAPAFAKFGPEHFLDFALTWRDVAADGMAVMIYGKNVANNRVRFPQAPHAGYVVEQNPELGLQCSYRF